MWAATGVGIAPFVSMVRAGAAGFTLLHGVRQPADLLYKDQLEPAASRYVPCLSGGEAPGCYRGRVTAWAADRLPRGEYDFFVCGNRVMIRDFLLLVDERCPGSRVYTEIFFDARLPRSLHSNPGTDPEGGAMASKETGKMPPQPRTGAAEVTGVFDDLLREEREFPPSAEFRSRAVVRDRGLYDSAAKDPEKFWENEAKTLHWFTPWTTVLDWTPPHARWFVGGTTNITYNAIDRHLEGPRRNKAAIIWEGENGDIRTLTYLQLHREVCKFANCLKDLGVSTGDRVAIYMPLLLETAVAMLACARIGAIHNVVFGGFSPDALADRINDSGCTVLITADGGWRRGTVVPLKHNADRALEGCPSVKHVVIVKNLPGEPHLIHIMEGRDRWYHRMMDHQKADCPVVPMGSEDTLFILYTSGTTGKPKGIVHSVGGYAVGVHTTSRYVFDLRDEDIFWCTADVGWVTGHSYVVYGPLLAGATVLLYEGAPDFPEKDRYWEIIARHRVSIFYTAPTAIRAFMKWGDELPARHDLSSLRLLGLGRGADQSRGVDVVPRAHRRRALPDRRHLVADRDRGDHDLRVFPACPP